MNLNWRVIISFVLGNLLPGSTIVLAVAAIFLFFRWIIRRKRTQQMEACSDETSIPAKTWKMRRARADKPWHVMVERRKNRIRRVARRITRERAA